MHIWLYNAANSLGSLLMRSCEDTRNNNNNNNNNIVVVIIIVSFIFSRIN